MNRTPLAVASAVACLALPAFAQQAQTPITVQVINDSGKSDEQVYLLLGGKSITLTGGTVLPFSVSGIANVDMGATSPPATTGTPLKCTTTCSTPIQPAPGPGGAQLTVPSPYSGKPAVPVYQFTMATVGSGVLFVSYDAGITYPPAPTVRTSTRFQPLEFSYSASIASNGDLTSIDFYGIPLELTTFAPGDTAFAHPQDRVTYYTSTATLLAAMSAADASLQCAFLRTDGQPFDAANPLAKFARIVGPNQVAAASTPPVTLCPTSAPTGWTGGTWPPSPPPGSPWPYPSFAGYLDSLLPSTTPPTRPAYTFTEADSNVVSAYTVNYTGTIRKMSPVTVTATSGALTTPAYTASPAVAPLSVIAGTASGPSALTMAFAPATIAAGGTATLTIAVPNATSTTASLSAPFYSVMPAGVIIQGTTAATTCTGVVLSPAAGSTQLALLPGAAIPAGGCTIVATVTSSRTGTVTGSTSVLQTGAYSVTTPAAAPLTVAAAGAAAVTGAFAPGTIGPGGASTLTVTLPNATASSQVPSAPFAVALPPGVTTTSANTGTCQTATGNPLALATGAAIPPGGCTIVVAVTSTAQGTTETCLDPRLAADGWLIKLTGTTAAASPLPSNADVCIPLPRRDHGYGSADFNIYGAPQNCETLGLAANNALLPCTDQDAAALGAVANSVYGWMQADVLAALNFGYMNGAADAAFGGGSSAVWYGMPPIQYPFGQARNGNDGFYNGWAAFMYNHSDAYGFAFSDRNGRPSPDIDFPVGGTLRIWILPDTRLDAPVVTATPGTCSGSPTSTCTVALAWPAVVNADHYVVAWSPPYTTQSTTVQGQTGYTVTGLAPGTPYTFTVRAYNADGSQSSIELPVYATTQGTAPAPAPGNAAFQFGFTWTPPAALAALGTAQVSIAGQAATYGGSGVWSVPATTPITLGPQPASTSWAVRPYLEFTGPYTLATIDPPVVQPAADGTWSANLTIVLGNGGGTRTPTSGANVPMPAGVALSQTSAQQAATTCPGAVVNQTEIVLSANPWVGNCAIAATMASAASGQAPAVYVVTVPAVSFTDSSQALEADVALSVAGANPVVTQTITAPTLTAGTQPVVPWGVPVTFTITLGNPTGAAAALIEPYVDHVPLHATLASPLVNAGTCPGVELTPYVIVVPAGTVVPAGGCTIVVNVVTDTPGTFTNTTGTALTTYPTQSFPLLISAGSTTAATPVWAANYYLTMMGVPDDYSVGPCLPKQHCIGSGLQNPVPWNTVKAPNFLERSTKALAIAGGVAQPGPPFGSTPNAFPNVTATFVPAPNKVPAPVVLPGAGSPP